MTPLDSLEQFNTCTFATEIIAKMIHYGRDCCLDVSAWIALVPECYRLQAIRGASEVANAYIGGTYDAYRTIPAYARDLSRWLEDNVERVPLPLDKARH